MDKNNSLNDISLKWHKQNLLLSWTKGELDTTSVEEVENFYGQLVPTFNQVFKNFNSKYYEAHLYKQNDTKMSKIQQIFAEWLQAIFSDPQIIRPNFSKTPNNQLSSFENKVDTKKMAWTVTYLKYQTQNNLDYWIKYILDWIRLAPRLSLIRLPNNSVRKSQENVVIFSISQVFNILKNQFLAF